MYLLALSKNGIIGIAVGALIGLIVLVLVVAGITTHNAIVALDVNCDEAWSNVDVYLKKRYDLIPNLVETVKGYTKHESETLEKVIAARNAAASATAPNAKIAADKNLGSALNKLFALKESYPDLKASAQFISLQNQLQAIETDLSQARKFYNGKCKALNAKIRSFPANIVAGMMRMEKRVFFELDSEEERQNVKVSF